MMGLTVIIMMVGMSIAMFEQAAPGILLNFIYMLEEMKFNHDLSNQIQAAIAALS